MTFDRGSTATLDTSCDYASATGLGGDRGPTATVTAVAPRAQRGPCRGDGTRSIRLAHTLVAVRESRETLVSDLRERGVSAPVIDEAESVVAELVANAVRHARALPDGCVRIDRKSVV